MGQLTARKLSLTCQSSAQGIIPVNRVTGDKEFTLAFIAPLALAAVSWSPPTRIFCIVAWRLALLLLYLAHEPSLCIAQLGHIGVDET